MKRLLVLGLAALPPILATCPASAQPSPAQYEEDGRQVFLPAYFNRFAPQTAADMVLNLPGFVVREADQNRRGLGQGGSNILINGARVSGKSTDPLDVLRRTSRDAVVRIEIVEGTSLDISGLSGQVANVVIDRDRRSGNIEWNPQFRKGLASRLTRGSISTSGSHRGIAYSIGLENESNRAGGWGRERVTGPAGALLDNRYDRIEVVVENPELAVSLEHTSDSGREANLNATVSYTDFDFSEISERQPTDPGAPFQWRRFAEGEDEWEGEISADYAFDALGGRLKLIGFQRLEHSPYFSAFRTVDEGRFTAGERYAQAVDEGETILRTEQQWSMPGERTFELGAEIVYNFNDAESRVGSVDVDGHGELAPLPSTRIEERRAEVSGAYSFPIGERLAIQASLAAEYSELEQSGDVERTRTFFRPKGFVSATYSATPTVELRGRIDRDVGQLEFGAFASFVDLNNGIDRMGNSDLVPQQSWIFEAAAEKSFADDSQMTLSLTYEDIEDIVQRIPIDGGEGVGNVDSATRWKASFIGTQMLDRFAIPGGRLEWEVTLRDSEIVDPFSGTVRELNGQTIQEYEVEFRHDIPNTDYAYGVVFQDFRDAKSFRAQEITQYDQSRPAWEIYAEHKNLYGFSVTAYVFNILNYTEDFTRDVFDAQRPEGTFLYREQRSIAFEPIIGLNVARSF